MIVRGSLAAPRQNTTLYGRSQVLGAAKGDAARMAFARPDQPPFLRRSSTRLLILVEGLHEPN